MIMNWDSFVYKYSNRSDLERIWKIAQYALKLSIPFVQARARPRKVATIIKTRLSDTAEFISNARLLLRVGDVLEDISDTASAINENTSPLSLEYCMGVAEPLSNAISDALDFVVLIGNILKRPKLSVWADYWCSALWLFAIVFETRRALQTIYSTPKEDAKPLEQARRRQSRIVFGYGALCKAICDVILGLSSLSPRIDAMTTLVDLSGLGGGVFGLLSSVVKMRQEHSQ